MDDIAQRIDEVRTVGYKISDNLGTYTLSRLPACDAVMVSHGVEINKEMRGKGLGQHQHRRRLTQALHWGSDYIICTVRADNAVEKHILNKFGWNKLAEFDSSDSCDDGHRVELWGRHVKKPIT